MTTLPPLSELLARYDGASNVLVPSFQIVSVNVSGEPSVTRTRKLHPVVPFTVPRPWSSAAPPTTLSDSNDVPLKVTFDSLAWKSKLPVGTVSPVLYFAFRL